MCLENGVNVRDESVLVHYIDSCPLLSVVHILKKFSPVLWNSNLKGLFFPAPPIQVKTDNWAIAQTFRAVHTAQYAAALTLTHLLRRPHGWQTLKGALQRHKPSHRNELTEVQEHKTEVVPITRLSVGRDEGF